MLNEGGTEPGAEAPADKQPGFLIVEDDEMVARSLARFFSRYGEVTLAGTVQQGHALMTELQGLAGLVVDVNLPDGSGIDFVERIRATHPALSVLVLTGAEERELANNAQALGADFVYKPPSKENLGRFAQRVSASHFARAESVTDIVAQFSVAHQLSPQESRILSLTIAGIQRADLHMHMGISENTLKTLVRRLLAKVGAKNLDELARTVMHSALFRSTPSVPGGSTPPSTD